ncbi:hypothetical protein [Streptomyces sp. CL12-4]|uniref:hypothetical protein n=1 Tax=Streptomyces sp. CL12-4 TaxID=2810306 RepID=UPI001FDD5D56|nr:hypothetical protein [Streptomyces sp. CL12-4]
MSLAELAFDQWRSFDLSTARRVARQAADRVGGRVVAFEVIEHLGTRMHRVRIERSAQEFALVPGGTVMLGLTSTPGSRLSSRPPTIRRAWSRVSGMAPT